MKLHELLTPEHIKLDVPAATREEVISELVALLSQSNAIDDPAAVTQSVIARERQMGTGVGYGVAIPHAEPGPYEKPIVAFGKTLKPLDFGAPEGDRARLIFLLLSPQANPALHVRLMARICRLSKSGELRKSLLRAKSPIEAATAIANHEADFPELTL